MGTAARNVGYGPGAVSIDTSLMKDFHFTEQRFLQLRGEFFTIINGPNFGLPNTTRGNAAFGTIISAADGRQIQIGMRIVF